MIDSIQFAELELRVNDLQNALTRVIEERDNYRDTADSLFKELEACRATLVQANSDITRLRIFLAQGAEL
jgi:septation ring formation regulator EzrA